LATISVENSIEIEEQSIIGGKKPLGVANTNKSKKRTHCMSSWLGFKNIVGILQYG
jgi:hypothetical protein